MDNNSNVHLPISFALTATGLLSSVTNFFASRRISMMLFNKANKGASGKDATNKVTNPNWITEKKKQPFQWLWSVFIECMHHHVSAIPPNSNKTTHAGRLNRIFCVRHGLPDRCSIRALKGQLSLLQKARQSNQKDGEAPKTVLPWARLAQEWSAGAGLQQRPC